MKCKSISPTAFGCFWISSIVVVSRIIILNCRITQRVEPTEGGGYEDDSKRRRGIFKYKSNVSDVITRNTHTKEKRGESQSELFPHVIDVCILY